MSAGSYPGGVQRHTRPAGDDLPGRPVQVDPRLTSDEPWFQRLKLKYYKGLSRFAFNFNLRRYSQVVDLDGARGSRA